MFCLHAHRLQTVRGADYIHVIEGGRLMEQGRFEELLARGGLFARLWADQTRHLAEQDVTLDAPRHPIDTRP